LLQCFTNGNDCHFSGSLFILIVVIPACFKRESSNFDGATRQSKNWMPDNNTRA